MVKKVFDVKVPRHIVMGDSKYFNNYKGGNCTNKIIKRKTTRKDVAKVKLEKIVDPRDNEKSIEITLYIAPKENIDVYVQDQYYKKQTIKQKIINIDSNEYLIDIDQKKTILKTDRNGWWGIEYIYRHKQCDKNMLDAIVINMSLPSDMSMKDAEQYVRNLFDQE
jgi:ribosomal 30S subunit maturation factor RimM